MGVLDHIRLTGQPLRFPLGQPVTVAPPDFLPLGEISGFERAQQHSAAEQGGHGHST
jgi:hypothetical protein